MKRFLLVLLCLLCLLTPAHAFQVEWRPVNAEQVALLMDGVHTGTVRLADGVYFPREGDGWGQPCECPVDIPAKYLPKPSRKSLAETGIIGKIEPRVSVGGDPDWLSRFERQAEAKPVKVPDYSHMASITIVSADPTRRAAIAKDFDAHPALAPWKDHRVTARDPNDPLMRPFKLAEDTEFAKSGVVLIVQPPEDERGRASVTSLYEYTSAEEVAGKLRDIEADYLPDETGVTPWTRLHVATAVGLCVAAVFSLIFGGLLKWAR